MPQSGHTSTPPILVGTLGLALAVACAPAQTPDDDPQRLAGVEAPADEPIRTADARQRGLTRDDFPRVHQIADHVYVYSAWQVRTDIEMPFVTNNLIVITDDGVLVADGQIVEADTERLVAEIGRLTPQPIRYVVVGSDHGDHVGGNAAFPDGTTFIAHPTSRDAIEQRNAGGGPPIPVPGELVSDSRTLMLGGTEIRILFLGRAHTGGDLSVYLPAEDIVFMSEAYFNRLFPSADRGYPSEWIEALRQAEALEAEIYVPGHGFIDSPRMLREELTEFRLALETVVSEGYRLHAAGVPLERAPRGIFLGPYGYWTRAPHNLLGTLGRVYAEAEGELE